MSLTLQVAIAGCLLGLLQLGVGVALGLWLRRPSGGSRDADLRHARVLALELHGLTHRIGGQVAEHRDRFEAADERLRNASAGKQHPTTDLVVGVVGEILAANRQLQSELTAAENQIAEQARKIESHLTTSLTDSLTSLPNRRALDQQLESRMQEYRQAGAPFSLLMVDVDRFKQINDRFGHPVGDEVLVRMGVALRGALRKHDFVARYGGEEFAIVLPHTTLNEAGRAAEKASLGVGTLTDEFGYFDREITASAGLATIQPGEEIESLVRRADQALYLAKQNGRDCTYVHDGDRCVPLSTPNTVIANEGNEYVASRPTRTIEHQACDELDGACEDLRVAMMGAVGQQDI